MKLLLVFFCFLLEWSISIAFLASFYGNSFIFQSMETSYLDTTTVSLRFQTSSANGLIFLAQGQAQYLVVELMNGKLEVKVNLGYGETILSTAEDQSLNNLIWHQFKVIRSGSNIKLVLNGIDVARDEITVPNARKAKLNIDFGLFLGGLGGNVTLPYGGRPSKYFRGCLLEAEFNGEDLLSSLTSIENERILYNVLSGCPKILRADKADAMTFASLSSYVAVKRWTTQDEGTFECMVKTSGRSGIILYNAGRGRGEFIALEMVDGVIGASVNKGGGVVALHTTSPINDGVWHSVRFSFSPSYLDIRVDGKQTKAFVEQTLPEQAGDSIESQHHNLDLTGHLYIGGVPDNLVHNNAVPHSLVSLSSSSKDTATIGGAFPGCMKNIRINYRRKSFSDFLISNQVSAGCKTIDHKNTKKHTNNEYQRSHSAVSNLFAVYTLEKSRTRTSTTSTTTTTIPPTTISQFIIPVLNVTTKTLSALEGKQGNFTEHELSFAVEGLRKRTIEKDILFVLLKPPSHGVIKSKDCNTRNTIFEFTTKDIHVGHLKYCHDGTETVDDSLSFNIVWNLENKNSEERKEIISHFDNNAEFISTGIALNKGEIYTMNITVTPVDDPPILHIPNEYLFQPIKNTITHLPSDILNCTDPDSSPSQIDYTILGNTAGGGCHIENENRPGMSITQFTQQDVNERSIVFVHTGDVTNARLIMRVSNVIKSKSDDVQSNTMHSPTAILRIAAIPLNISVVTREVTMLEKSSFIFTKEYFEILTNAESDSVILHCNIEKGSAHGEIQVMMQLQEDGNVETWLKPSNFTSSQLFSGKVRYQNLKVPETTKSIVEDRFEYTVSGAGVETSSMIFKIKIKKVEVTFLANEMLLTNGIQEKKLTGEILKINITHIHATSNQIQIQLEKAVKHATLLYNDNGLEINQGDTFTLDEAQTGRISLRVRQKYAAKSFNEMISLVATINDIYSSEIMRLNLTYVPDLERILLTNKGLKVLEGKEQVINSRILKASLPASAVNDNVKRFRFTITENPQHGKMRLKDENTANPIETESDSVDDGQNVTEFTSVDLERGSLYYIHDDSETISDFLSFRVVPILEGELPQTVAKLSTLFLDANFTVTIDLVNDQRPVRVVDRSFQIARNSERLLTRDDLWYKDDDIDYNDLDLTFSGRGITNGQIVNATSRRHGTILKFNQRQILNGEVLIKHEGDDFGRFIFWVRDGKHYATGLLVVTASEPFVKIINASEVTVIKGRSVEITNENLWSETNIKGLQRDITYRITKGAENGILYLNHSTKNEGATSAPESVTSFTQQDIYDKILVYEHSGSPVMEDSFQFEVTAGSTIVIGNLTVKAVLESHQKPPSVQKNRTIVVAQGEKIQIRKQDLRVVHPDTRATDIVFTVSNSPMMGSLDFLTNIESKEFNTEPVTEFTQSDINKGLVWYVQNSSFPYFEENFVDDTLLDYFTFDVTNNILSVTDLRLYFDIIPDKIPLRVNNFTVREGRTKAIIKEYLRIQGTHFDDTAVEIKVTSPPSYGILESTQQVGVQLKSFSYRLATAEFLYYAHDGSEFLQDTFSLQAFTLDGKKKSEIVTSYVNIIPENDEYPVVINNTGMNVWINSTTGVTSTALGVHDPDTASENITYRILPPSNGQVAMKNDISTAILEFTQTQIDSGMIVFVHKGPSTGGFTFQVDDGANYASKRIFVITAKPLILKVVKNEDMKAFPGMSVPITSEILKSTTNGMDLLNRTITYKVTTQPKLGKIIKMLMTGNKTEVILEEFTQKDIDMKTVFFKQDTELPKWSGIDSFVLTASSPPATSVTDVKIMINITYDAYAVVGRNSPIRTNKGVTVTEGEKFTLGFDMLDAGNLYRKLPPQKDKKPYILFYSVLKLPLHGKLSISGKNVTTENTSFTQDSIFQKNVAYQHDHSDTSVDSFNFEVYLADKRFTTSSGKPWIVPGTSFHDMFSISITPVNDNPPKLLTKGKVLIVVDGFKTPILDNVLKAVDPDNAPEEVTYSIIRPSSRGHVSFINDSLTKISKFTQKDVDDGNVIFVPNQINMTTPDLRDVFYFGVTDGIQRPAYNLFQIKIVSVFLHFQPRTLEITQATFSNAISINLLNVSTNGNVSLISFQVLKQPKSGVILVNGEESDIFTYEQVLNGEITFAMTGNEISEDTMSIKAQYLRKFGNNISVTATMNIKVKPLVTQGSISASNDGLTRIQISALNATVLLKKTHSMPFYTVVQKPKKAKILKVVLPDDNAKDEDVNMRQRRAISEKYAHLLKEVDKFTHDDVLLGSVFLHTNNVNATNTSIPDSIKLRLDVEDGSAQSAEFNFNFTIVNAEQVDYSTFFEQFIEKPEESTTIGEMDEVIPTIYSNMTTSPFVNIPVDVGDDEDSIVDLPVDDINDKEMSGPKNVASDDPKPAEDSRGLPWMIPVAIGVALIIIVAIVIVVVLLQRHRSIKRNQKHEDSAENQSLTSRDDVVAEDIINGGETAASRGTKFPGESLTSPACPGVKVTLLSTGTHSEVPDIIQSSIYTGTDRHSISIINSGTHPQSYLGENSTTIYTPSTVYHYEDSGSVDFTDGAEDEFYLANQGAYPQRRLYHARSDRFIDPDVLALYSSDESIPSMIDEKYAMPYRGSGMDVTGSVPAGLHRTISQPGTSRNGIASRASRPRSTASLSKAALSPELSLVPNAGLEANQYWI